MRTAFQASAQHYQNELLEQSRRIHAYEAHQAETSEIQTQALDVMMKKIDKLSGLTFSQAGQVEEDDNCQQTDDEAAEDDSCVDAIVKDQSFGRFADPPDTRPFAAKVASSAAFEMVFGLLIVLNTIIMCVDAEYRGWAQGEKLVGIEGSLGTTQATTDSADLVFYVLELLFGIVFTFEVLV